MGHFFNFDRRMVGASKNNKERWKSE